MRLKKLLLVFSLPLFFDHVIQAPEVSLTQKREVNMKGTRKTKHKNDDKAQQTQNIHKLTLKRTKKRL